MGLSFNLVNEAWIPCILPSGERVELSLGEVFVRAHRIREIFDGSPLVTGALHRLLLVVLHRVFGPPGDREWLELWREGSFDARKLGVYWKTWRGRFDLFDSTHPFYQSTDPELRDSLMHPVARLAQERASGNNHTLFDQSFNEAPHCSFFLLLSFHQFFDSP
jgi:CRISPR system Cascade subunit CasA